MIPESMAWRALEPWFPRKMFSSSAKRVLVNFCSQASSEEGSTDMATGAHSVMNQQVRMETINTICRSAKEPSVVQLRATKFVLFFSVQYWHLDRATSEATIKRNANTLRQIEG